MKANNLFFSNSDSNPEKALWKAVILQAFIDLQTNSKKKIAKTFRTKALFWFNIKNKNFVNACNCAGLDPNFVLDKASKIKERIFYSKTKNNI